VAGQQCLDRQQAGQAFGLVHGFQRASVTHCDSSSLAGVNAAQKRQVCTAPEGLANVFTQRADVGSLAAQ
jgi:hypothetical protein